ncbi:MAG: outer membrane beta-barrel protein [Bacteroidales bacterium]|nr:outer membrane beta-barrel protein [Bacteroidales bacterium]
MDNKKIHIDQLIIEKMTEGTRVPSRQVMNRIASERNWKTSLWSKLTIKHLLIITFIILLSAIICLFSNPLSIDIIETKTESNYTPPKAETLKKELTLKNESNHINEFLLNNKTETAPQKTNSLNPKASQSSVQFPQTVSQIIKNTTTNTNKRSSIEAVSIVAEPELININETNQKKQDSILSKKQTQNNNQRVISNSNQVSVKGEKTEIDNKISEKNKNTTTDPDNNNTISNHNSKIGLHLGLNTSFNYNTGSFNALNNTYSNFVFDENNITQSKLTPNLGVDITLSHKNFELGTGLILGKASFQASYTSLPMITDTTFKIEYHTQEVWNFIYQTDTLGNLNLIDSVFSHTHTDTITQQTIKTTSPPKKNTNYSISYLKIPLHFSYKIRKNKHSFSPLCGITFNFPLKASGNIRKRNYTLDSFENTYQTTEIFYSLNAGISYSYALNSRFEIYSTLIYQSGLNPLFRSRLGIEFRLQSFQIKSGIRFKLL